MAKFTVYFNQNVVNSEFFDSGVVHIGRDETNNLVVDSLAVAPAHAAVIIKESGCIIKQLNEEYPLIINNSPTKESALEDKDRIIVGKHSILFSDSESVSPPLASQKSDADIDSLNEKLGTNNTLPEANLQVMNGPHIGRILPLKKTMTRVGNSGSGIAVISHRKDGYYISTLENSEHLAVNKKPLGEKSIKLSNNDVISIEQMSMQFFC